MIGHRQSQHYCFLDWMVGLRHNNSVLWLFCACEETQNVFISSGWSGFDFVIDYRDSEETFA